MSGLKMTRYEIIETIEFAENYYDKHQIKEPWKTAKDWLAMYELLCGDDGVLDVIGNAIVDIQDLAHPSEGIKIDQKELIELGKKIRVLIGGE